MGDYIDNQLTGRSVDKDWFSFVDINVIVWQQFCHFPAALDLQSEYNIRFILKWNKTMVIWKLIKVVLIISVIL